MPSKYPYQRTIRNEYLGVSKTIRAMSIAELEWLIEQQEAKWREQETRKRKLRQNEAERRAAKRRVDDLKSQAAEDTAAANKLIESFKSILRDGVRKSLRLDWDQLIDRRTFPPFRFSNPKPDLETLRSARLGREPAERRVQKPSREEPWLLEPILPFLRRRRLQRERKAMEEYEREVRRARKRYEEDLDEYEEGEKKVRAEFEKELKRYHAVLAAEKQKHEKNLRTLVQQQEQHNQGIAEFRARYESGDAEAVERYSLMALEKSSYPEGVEGDPTAQFDPASGILVVGFWLPNPDDVPRTVEHRYVAARAEIKQIEMNAKTFDACFDDVLHQIGLRTVHEILTADYATHIRGVVFNGWVRGTDPKTGKPFTSCIISFQAERTSFLDFDLGRVVPKECVRSLKGITAGPLAMLAPVKPIMDIKTDDDRFVESKNVLEQLSPADNLAAMDWEDFEHLVRELFEKEFAKTGGEVHVTQASRDRGVDAIAFDPNPIRGGKFVIQAKRYNMVVPVAAVRDLYGTMLHEGATKGILVTTSHFGHDSREFAKDKPITLIDGENLVYLFQKHGYNLHIALLPKGDPRRGL